MLPKKAIEGVETFVCTNKKHAFPTYMGWGMGHDPKQYLVNSFDELIHNFEEYKDTCNLYCRVFSEWQVDNNKFDKVYFDEDSEKDIKLAYKEMQLINNFLNDYFDCTPRNMFTANKGFSIYIDFPETKLDYDKIRWFADNFRSALKLAYMDIKVTKTVRRISRLPYSINKNTNIGGKKEKLCIPINPKWSMHKILTEAKECTFAQDIVVEPCKEIRDIITHIKEPEYTYNNKNDTNNLTIFNLKDIKIWTDNADIIPDGRHRIIYECIIPALVKHENVTDEMIHAVCQKFIETSGKNYSEYRYMVSTHIKRNRQYKFKPKTFDELLLEHPDIFFAITSDIGKKKEGEKCGTCRNSNNRRKKNMRR